MPEIKIGATSFALILLLLTFEGIPFTLTLIICVLIHETGHILASYAFGVKIRSVNFNLYGARIELASSLSSYISEFLIAAAGPAANIVFGGIFVFLQSSQNEGVSFFSLVNFSLALINMLPISNLDGGRMISCLTSQFFGSRVSYVITSALSAVTIAALWIISVFLWLVFAENVSLFILCLYVFYSMIIKRGF